jgi:hypothetical protein
MPLLCVKKNPPMQPHTNPVLPEENLSSYTDKLYRNLTISIPSSHQELPYTEFGTKEMSSGMNTSQMLTHSAFSSTSSASRTSSFDNGRNGWELMQPLSNETNEETESSEDSNVSGTSSWNDNACGGMSKETLTASRTSVPEELKKCLLLSRGTQGKHKCAVCIM